MSIYRVAWAEPMSVRGVQSKLLQRRLAPASFFYCSSVVVHSYHSRRRIAFPYRCSTLNRPTRNGRPRHIRSPAIAVCLSGHLKKDYHTDGSSLYPETSFSPLPSARTESSWRSRSRAGGTPACNMNSTTPPRERERNCTMAMPFCPLPMYL